MNSRRLAWCLPLAAVLTAGCFATRNDVRLLQADVARLAAEAESARAAMEARAARRDSLLRAALNVVEREQQGIADSMLVLTDALRRFRAAQGETNYQIEQKLANLQEQMGTNQRTMAGIRSQIEARRDSVIAETGRPGGGSDTSVAAGDPLPRQLHQLGLDQLENGANGVARSMFREFLEKYPDHELVPETLYWLAETYARDQMDATADSVYAGIVDRFPRSSRAPVALLKRADALAKAGQTAQARRMYDRILAEYPNAAEALVARDRKANLPPP
jgi:tol-pal system protein YbgF